MEANGFKRRLIEAKDNNQFLKLIFQYPASDRAIIKRGFVVECYEDSFDFEEKFDGVVTFSYKWIAEIKDEDRD